MTMMECQKAMINIGSSAWALYLLHLFYSSFWNTRILSKIIRYLVIVFFIFIWIFASLITSVSRNILCGLFLYECAAWFYQGKASQHLILPIVMLLVVNGIQNSIGFYLAHHFGENFNYLLETNILFYFCSMSISNFVLYVFVKIIQAFKRKRTCGFSITGIFPILLFPLTSIIAGLIIMQTSSIIEYKNLELEISGFYLMLIVSYFYFIYVLEKQAEQERIKQKLLFMENINRMQLNYYQELYNGQAGIRNIRHDLKNTLLALSGMIKSGDTQKVLSKIRAICGELDSAGAFVQTNIPSLDAVLSAKIVEMIKYQIEFSYQVAIPYLKIDEVEFSILIANALDNAIEACQRLEPSFMKPSIELKISASGLYLFSNIKNSCPPGQQELETWKEDKENHGLGLENMKKIIERYDGNMTLKNLNGIFFTSIILKNS